MPPTIPVLNASENFPLMELCNNIYGRNSATKRIRFRRYRISRAFANLRVLFIASVFCGRIPKQRFETYKIFNVSPSKCFALINSLGSCETVDFCQMVSISLQFLCYYLSKITNDKPSLFHWMCRRQIVSLSIFHVFSYNVHRFWIVHVMYYY